MGLYDVFTNKSGKVSAQLKCFECILNDYKVGDKVPVKGHGFPESCTFADWGGHSKLFYSFMMGDEEMCMGVFVVVRNGVLHDVTENEKKIFYPVYSKLGNLLKDKLAFLE